MGGKDGIVGLHNSSGNLGSWVDGKLQLGLLAVVDRETLHQERGESRSSATTKGVEEKESLKSRALVSKLADTVKNQIHNLLSDGVVTTSVVVGSILLSSDELLWVEELAVSASPHLINDSGLQVNENSSWDVLSGSSLGKEGGEGVVATHELVRGHLTVRLDAVLQAVELPAGIADLAASLANVDGDALTLKVKENGVCYRMRIF